MHACMHTYIHILYVRVHVIDGGVETRVGSDLHGSLCGAARA